MEERSEQPLVVAFHDFMSDSEVEHYKAEAVKNMIRQEENKYKVVIQHLYVTSCLTDFA